MAFQLSERGERVIMAAIAMLTLLIQSYFAVRIEGARSEISEMREELKARPVYYGETK